MHKALIWVFGGPGLLLLLVGVGFRKSEVVFDLNRGGVNAKETGLVVAEGFFDAFRVWQAGFQQVVSIMGSSLSKRQRDILEASVGAGRKVSLLLDRDDAGRACLNQCLDELSPRVFVKTLGLPNEGDQPDNLSKEQIQRILAD